MQAALGGGCYIRPRMTEECKHERVRLTNRMREQLWRYYPQILDRKRHLLSTLRGGSSRARLLGWFPEQGLDQAA